MRLPGAATYAFGYGTQGTWPKRLWSIELASDTLRRTTTFWPQNGDPRLWWVEDPDSTQVRFDYTDAPGQTGRVLGRLDRMGQAWVRYGYDSGGKLLVAQADGGAAGEADDVIQRFTPAEMRGADAVPVLPDSAYLLIDGPRDDVQDKTRIWTGRWGMPVRIANALGHETLLTRGDLRFPALVTEADAPGANGTRLVTRAGYTARGLPDSTVVVDPLGDGRNATTRYAYEDQRWPDFVTRIVDPVQVETRIGYDDLGNRSWQQTGPDSARRVHFEYYGPDHATAPGLPMSVQSAAARARGEAAERYTYDALGNVATVTTPSQAGATPPLSTTYHRDGLGRDTLVSSPITASQVQTTRRWYDAAGNDTLTLSWAPGRTELLPGGAAQEIPEEALRVRTAYDDEGRVLSVARRSEPDPARIGWVITRYAYDALGRKVAEIAPDSTPDDPLDNPADSMAYDPAGNLIRTTSRLGDVVRMRYDELNRLTERSVPAVTRQVRSDTVRGLVWSYPRYTADGNGAYQTPTPQGAAITSIPIPGEEARFYYDAAGNLERAENGDAHVVRSYYPGGLLRTDTLKIRTYGGQDFSTHAYGLTYRYDLAGRRTVLVHPENIAPKTTGREQGYEYDDTTGALSRIIDLGGRAYTFAYNAEGQLDTLRRGSMIEAFRYNTDGLLEQRTETNGISVLHNDRYQYDVRGKAVRVDYIDRFAVNVYSGLGSLARVEENRTSSVNPAPERRERFYNDALGNRVRSLQEMRSQSQATYGHDPGELAWKYQPGTGRLRYAHLPADTAGKEPDQWNFYDRAGNRVKSGVGTLIPTPYEADEVCVFFGTQCYTPTNSSMRGLVDIKVQLYDGAGRLHLVDRRACLLARQGCDLGKQPPPSWRSAFEEYRYDALGRRVLVRTRQDYACTTNCLNALRRVVWDGDQILYEINAPGWTSAGALMQRDTGFVVSALAASTTFDPRRISFPNPAYRGFFYGRVMYTHGGGIDQPLSLMRMEYSDSLYRPSTILPHADWRGSYDMGTGIPCRQIAVTDRLKPQPWEPGMPDTVPTQYADHCMEVDWPAPHMFITRARMDRDFLGPRSWMGSLLNEQRDASGQMYRRNRYYDPTSGRFTQEDPIGIAGGLNVYGFANGDPVTYSDPYGLSPNGCPPVCLLPFAPSPGYVRATAALAEMAPAAARTLGAGSLRLLGAVALTLTLAGDSCPSCEAEALQRQRDQGETLTRFGPSSQDDAAALESQAHAAQKLGFPHGVSVTARNTPHGRKAPRSVVETQFPVHNTPTRDKRHRTVELPHPVTPTDAERFNGVFRDP